LSFFAATVAFSRVSKTTVLKRSQDAAARGADALLIVTPYYNKGTKNGILRHYLTIAESTPLPICLYNVPSRTGVDLPLDTLQELAEHENIVAIKEASNSIDRVAEIISTTGDRLTVYSGNDSQILPILALGGQGVISVVSNLYPRLTAKICDAYFASDMSAAQFAQMKLLPIIKLLFAETNPAPIKAALEIASACQNELRLPMSPVSDSLYEKLKESMRSLEDSI
jgi:4-hydroxy-tetrahydrodipicolinate synthase